MAVGSEPNVTVAIPGGLSWSFAQLGSVAISDSRRRTQLGRFGHTGRRMAQTKHPEHLQAARSVYLHLRISRGRNGTWALLPPWSTPNVTQLLDGSPRRTFRAGFVTPLPLWW